MSTASADSHQAIVASNTSARPDPAPPRPAPRSFIALFTLATLLAGTIVLKPFWVPIFVGATLAGITYPIHRFLLARMPKRPGTAAFLSSMVILGVIVTPILALVAYAVTELSEGLTWLATSMETMSWDDTLAQAPRGVRQAVGRAMKTFDLSHEDLHRYAEQAMEQAKAFLPGLFGASLTIVAGTLFSLISCAIFLTEGPALVKLLVETLPLAKKDVRELIGKYHDVASASFVSFAVTALSHSAVVAIGFWLAGVPHVLFFAILTTIGAFVPVLSSLIVFLPVGAVLFALGHKLLGIGLVVGCFVGSQVLDNLLTPIAQRGGIPLNGALGFFSAFGGLFLFGLTGAMLGPMAMVTFTTLLAIYRRDYDPRTRIDVI